ncbi:hypothetical protein BJ742DRAFT_787163 [Cladochytrium replicatum]|nr:hypothetical protein BJ742DRAFT_787163 [Cladochytrium replicatum]
MADTLWSPPPFMDPSTTSTEDASPSLALTSPTTTLDAEQIYNLTHAYERLPFRAIATAVYAFLILFTTVLFVAFRKERAIRAHSVSLAIAQTLTILIGMPLTTLQIGMFGSYPCFFTFIGLYYGLCMWGFVVIGRALRLHIIFRFHRDAAVNYLADLDNRAVTSRPEEESVWAESENRFTSSRSRSPQSPTSTHHRSLSRDSVESTAQLLKHRKNLRRQATKAAWMVIMLGFLAVTAYTIVTYFATDSIKIADDLFSPQDPRTVVGVPGKTKRGISCTKSDPVWWPAFAFIAAHMLITTPTALYFHWRTNDAYGIRQDLFVTNLFAIPGFILYFLIAMFWWKFNSVFGPNDVLLFMFGVSHFMSVVVPLFRTFMEVYRRKRLKLNVDSFEMVLHDPQLFNELKEFAIRDFCSEQTIFIEQVQKFKEAATQALFSQPDTSPKDRALKVDLPVPDSGRPIPYFFVVQCTYMLEIFIRPGGSMELNLSASTRQSCIDQIESGRVTLGVFDAPYGEVANSLYLNTYPKFVRSLSDRNLET